MNRSKMVSGWGICASRVLVVIGLCLLALSGPLQQQPVVRAVGVGVEQEQAQVSEDSNEVDESDVPVYTTESLKTSEPGQDKPEDNSKVAVVAVIDGDTIDVLLGGVTERVRLIGIDTPEVLDQRKPVQCFGREASAYMHRILDNQQITLQNDSAVGNRDKYHRLLRYVFLGNQLVNETLVSEGFAHEYTYQTSYQYQVEFKNAELTAQRTSVGFWSPLTCNGNTTKPA